MRLKSWAHAHMHPRRKEHHFSHIIDDAVISTDNGKVLAIENRRQVALDPPKPK